MVNVPRKEVTVSAFGAFVRHVSEAACMPLLAPVRGAVRLHWIVQSRSRSYERLGSGPGQRMGGRRARSRLAKSEMLRGVTARSNTVATVTA
jgi:hypothetical protein